MAAHAREVQQGPADVCEHRPAHESEHEPQRPGGFGRAAPEREDRRPERCPESQALRALESHGIESDANGIPRLTAGASMHSGDP